MHESNIRRDDSRIIIDIDDIPVAEVVIWNENLEVKIDIKIEGDDAYVMLYHYGNASLLPAQTALATPRVIIHMLEIDMRQSESGAIPKKPLISGADNDQKEVDIVIIPPANVRLPGESFDGGEHHLSFDTQTAETSEFEQRLLGNRGLINGAIFDPEIREIIGYRVPSTTGMTRIVDREGEIVFQTEIGLKTPVVDPVDLIPTPTSLAKAGAGIGGKLIVKGALKKQAASGTKLAGGIIAHMRGVSKALASRASRKVSEKALGLVRIITEEGLKHSFDKHAAEWFGRNVNKKTHWAIWRSLIERAAKSRLIFSWSLGGTKLLLIWHE
jgi:hypothetical protein